MELRIQLMLIRISKNAKMWMKIKLLIKMINKILKVYLYKSENVELKKL